MNHHPGRPPYQLSCSARRESYGVVDSQRLQADTELKSERRNAAEMKEPALILLLTSFLAIPLARQSCLDAALLTGLQIVGVTFNFLDDVLLLYLPLKPA